MDDADSFVVAQEWLSDVRKETETTAIGSTAPGGPGHCPLMRNLARLRRADVTTNVVTKADATDTKAIDETWAPTDRLDPDQPEDVKVLVEVIVAVLHDHYGAHAFHLLL